ncbi:MAG: peptide ABC transporter substrate-binding protein [Clostridia bacterium]|nr:peptide ABC transporter substrate-binding protein [Clostridia bacterium]
MKKVLSLVLAMITAGSVLAGCTTLEKDETGNYDKGAIIDMYLTTEVYDFDPQNSITDDAMLKAYSLMYEGLTTIDENGKWQKALMKNYKVEKDAEGEFSILITLNNTRWSDGRTVQAADFVYSWKRLLEADAANEASSLLYDIKNARDVKTGDATVDDLGIAAVDTYVLQVEFEQKVDLDLFFENCSSIALVPLREDVITRYKDNDDVEIWAQKSTSIVTNGPFCPKEIIYGTTLRLERSSYYYLDAEKEEPLDKFVIPYRLLTTYGTGTAEDQLAALNSGSIFYNGELPLSARAQYANDVNLTDMMGTHTYVFNTNNSLFAKPEVRKALSMAIDRNQIVSIVTYAKAATGYVPYKVFDSKSGTSFREVGGNILSSTADVAGAKSLLSSAGVNGGSFTLSVRNNEVDLAIADYVAGVWGDLGFNVTVEAVKTTANSTDPQNLKVDNFQLLYDSGEFDVIAIDMMMLSTDAFSALSQFAVSFSGNGVDMDSENYDLYGHVSGYANEEYNALIESAYAEKDRAARAAILHQAEAKLLEDMPVIPVVFLQDAYLSSTELSGIESTYYGTRDFKDVQLKDYMTYKARTASASEEGEG